VNAETVSGTGTGTGTVRLLPWSTPDGRPCYLLGGGAGRVSRVADAIENTQLDMAADLLGHAADLLADHRATAPQVRYLAGRLTESLRDTHRIAESRGARLPVPARDADTDDAADRPRSVSGRGPSLPEPVRQAPSRQAERPRPHRADRRRDTKAQGKGPVLAFTGTAWTSFVQGIRMGDFAIEELGV
jgi:hypothetical protein